MEVVDSEAIKVPNSVIISGVTETELDEELTDFLNRYGRIARTIRIDDPNSPYHKNVIVEYESGASVSALDPMLPHTYESPSEVTYQIRALSSEYVPTVTESATQSFLGELQKIAKLSGKAFEDILQEQLLKCSKTASPGPVPENEPETESSTETRSEIAQPVVTQLQAPGHVSPVKTVEQAESPQSATESVVFSSPKKNEVPVTAMSYVNPPEVQRMVVEHVVRSEAPVSLMNASFRLRQFSGKTPCPNHEIDFDTWRNSVELILKDPALSDLQRSRKILDSLVPPAANVVKPLGPNALPAAYLELLDSAFGIVEDGDELFAAFLSTLQDSGEKPSQYLHRLQTVLAKALKRGGVSADEVDRHLLRQFCRGCWDNMLIADLQLERKRDNPPPFSELLLQLRVEEDKQSAKESRKKKHLGAVKQKASANLLAASSLESTPSVGNDITEMRKLVTELQSQLTRLKTQKAESSEHSSDAVVTDLKKQVAELQSQLTGRKAKVPPKTKTNASKPGAKRQPKNKESDSPSAADQRPSNRPRPWYCFQCGEDGHIASVCLNEPNPPLVAAKKTQLKEKQSLWDSLNDSTSPQRLNCNQPSSWDK